MLSCSGAIIPWTANHWGVQSFPWIPSANFPSGISTIWQREGCAIPFQVKIGDAAISTDPSSLKDFRKDLNLAFKLPTELASLRDTALANIPASQKGCTVSYTSGAQSWSIGDSPITFGLKGGASGTLAIVTDGDLLSYTDGLDSPQQKSISVGPNLAYVKLALNFNILVSGSGAYSGGAYGVKGAPDTSDTFEICFCKAFAPTTLAGDAVAHTFESFVLPLHKQTLEQMNDGDYLLHGFDGNLHLSFGVYAGLDRVLYAGQASVDVLKTFGSPLATIGASAKPEIKAGVSLDFAFQYATRFEALLSKIGSKARLHLYRAQSATSSTTLKAGLTFDANTSPSITAHTKTVVDDLVKVAGGPNSPGGTAVKQVLNTTNAASEIDKYIAEANDKLASWVSRAIDPNANLQLAIETSSTRTLLAGYDFDMTSNQYGNAWQAAIDGDFVKAFQTGAVTLDIGSGLEREYQSKTSFSCNFFNLWHFSTWSQFSSNASLVYAGNNVFHFVAHVGRATETDSMGAMHSMDLYFAANADVPSRGQLSNIDVELHIDLTAKSDPKAAAAIATILSAIEGGPACDALARSMHSFANTSRNGTAQLRITIPPSAYRLINCGPYIGDQPQTNSIYNDSVNWNAFAKAADDLDAWSLRNMSTVSAQNLAFLKTFQAWEALNLAANRSAKPNRVHEGNAFNQWPDGFPRVDDSTRNSIVYAMVAGQGFMNFCAALHDLANIQDVTSAGVTWNSLLNIVTHAIKEDLNVDFLRPTALAIVRLCDSPVSTFSGPNSTTVPANHFAVSIAL